MGCCSRRYRPGSAGCTRNAERDVRRAQRTAPFLEDLPGIEDVTRARGQLRRVVELAREHFAVEERILFGLARRVLPQERFRRWAANTPGGAASVR